MLPIDANEQDLMRAQILEKFTLVASAVYSGSLRYVKDVPESMTAANSTGADSLPTLIVVKLTLYVGLHAIFTLRIDQQVSGYEVVVVR